MNRRKFIKRFIYTSAGLVVSSCVSSQKLVIPKGDPLFSFIFCNDTHINTEEHAKWFAKSVTNWNTFSNLYNFVVVCGDLVENGQKEEFSLAKGVLDRLDKPYYVVLGNHDVSGEGNQGKEAYHAAFGTGRENYIIHQNGVALLFLDLTHGQRSNVSVQQQTLTWLKSNVPQIPKSMPIIVFSHFPLHPQNPRFPVKNSSSLFEIMDTREVLAYFSGHFHGKWQGDREGVRFFSNTCLSLLKNNYDGSEEEGYLFVQVFETEVTVRFFSRGLRPV